MMIFDLRQIWKLNPESSIQNTNTWIDRKQKKIKKTGAIRVSRTYSYRSGNPLSLVWSSPSTSPSFLCETLLKLIWKICKYYLLFGNFLMIFVFNFLKSTYITCYYAYSYIY